MRVRRKCISETFSSPKMMRLTPQVSRLSASALAPRKISGALYRSNAIRVRRTFISDTPSSSKIMRATARASSLSGSLEAFISGWDLPLAGAWERRGAGDGATQSFGVEKVRADAAGGVPRQRPDAADVEAPFSPVKVPGN